jgi:hypothetical protein
MNPVDALGRPLTAVNRPDARKGQAPPNKGASFLPEAIKRIARQAGIQKRCHAHALRHTFASETIRENIALPVVSRMLGHADTRITHSYLNHTLAPLEAIEAMQRRGPASEPPDLTAELVAQVAALRTELTDQLAALAGVQSLDTAGVSR